MIDSWKIVSFWRLLGGFDKVEVGGNLGFFATGGAVSTTISSPSALDRALLILRFSLSGHFVL